MSGCLTIETPVLLRELASDDLLVQSMVLPELAAAGHPSEVRIELELLLSTWFASLRPDQLARFAASRAPALRNVSVLVPRPDLRGKLEIKTPIDVPCVVTPARADQPDADLWVYLVPLDTTAYVRAGEDFDAIVRSEVQRVAAARELSQPGYLALLPTPRTWVETLAVPVSSQGPSGSTAVSSLRAEVEAARRREADEVLRSVAQPFGERGRARPVLERTRELALLASLLEGSRRTSVLFVGEPGAGKSSLFASWFEASSARHAAPPVYVTSGAQLLAGMGGFGEWQERLGRVLAAAELLDAILYVEDLRDLLLSRREQGPDMAGFIRPWLEAGRLRLIGELPRDALDEAERRQPSFLANMSRVALDPLTAASMGSVLRAHAQYHARHEPHRAQVGPDALIALEDLAARYLPYGVRPGAVVRLYDELRAVDRVRAHEHGQPIHAQEVYAWFSARSGVPLFLLREDLSLRRESLERELDRQLVGQETAKRAVVDTLCIVKAQLAPRDKPLASFLFVGPTGVGKTELARALAQVLFGDPERLVRFDLSEYADPYAAARLIRGDQRSDGLLTRKVREQPFSVVLLDEVEKAHPSVFDLLLQVLGEARLSDARGRTAFFHNAIIVMTSNLGTTQRALVGFGSEGDAGSSSYLKAVRDTFRPELVNRIDKIVPFAALTRDQILPVARMLSARIAERRGLREVGLGLVLGEAALSRLAEGGFSETYGARGMRRHLEHVLTGPLARLCALHSRAKSADTLAVDVAPPHDALIEPIEAAGLWLALCARQRAPQRSAPSGGAVAQATASRRQLAQWFALDRVESCAQEHESLVVELAQVRRKAGYVPLTASLEARDHALRTILDALRGAYDEVSSLEELALFALRSGEPAPPVADDLTAAEQRFKRALREALLVDELHRHQVTLLVSEVDDRRGLDRWLLPYLERAPRLGHSVSVRVDEGGSGRRWGALLGSDEAAQRVGTSAREFRSVLVHAHGPDARILLGLQSGHVQYKSSNLGDASLAVGLVAASSVLSERDLEDSALKPRLREELELVRRTRPSRLFDERSGVLLIAGGRDSLACSAREHFDRIDEITLRHLLLFEQEEGLDRDETLRAALPIGGRR